MNETIKQVLMRRDRMSEAQAAELIESAVEALQEYLAEGDLEGAENICGEYFGLEPDYILELLYRITNNSPAPAGQRRLNYGIILSQQHTG